MFKNIFNTLLDNPFIASIVIADLLILLFHKPPFFFSLAMFAVLIAYSMFLGQKLSFFKD